MNEQQQELYEKLLKKVNEYCLGYAAEDVIEAIDALVDTYEEPKIDPATTTPLQALEKLTNYKCSCMSEKIECKEIVETALKALENYRKRTKEWESGHSVDFSKVRFELQELLPDPDDIGKKLKALEIIKKYFPLNDVHNFLYIDAGLSRHVHPEECKLLTEVLK